MKDLFILRTKRWLTILLSIALIFSFNFGKGKTAYADTSPSTEAWDGISYDISWYNTKNDTFYLYTAEQFAGFALIVNNKKETAEAGTGLSDDFDTTTTAIQEEELKAARIDISLPADDFISPAATYVEKSSNAALGTDYTQKTVILAADIDLGAGISTAALLEKSDSGTYSDSNQNGYKAPEMCATSAAWTPIGSYSSSGSHTKGSDNGKYGRPFKGVFNGNYHNISNIYIPIGPNTSYASDTGDSHALFGDLGLYGIVKNVNLLSGYIYGARYTGGIVGRNWGTIDSCYNGATVETTGSRGGGGVAGVNYKNNVPSPKLKNSINTGIVATGDQARPGGIVSDNEGVTADSALANCYNIGKLTHKTAAGTYVSGGIVGGQRASNLPVTSFSIYVEEENPYSSRLVGSNANTQAPTGSALGNNGFLTEGAMKSEAFVITLGAAYQYNENDYPSITGAAVSITNPTNWTAQGITFSGIEGA
ncbi:MAG: hypothetical protein LBD41_04395, partial [Clostridiales Family XIII bacterium]|nr:hypothetical protein [Clostridiales Family XIII bacterium]